MVSKGLNRILTRSMYFRCGSQKGTLLEAMGHCHQTLADGESHRGVSSYQQSEKWTPRHPGVG
jgi:hypothetical protein